MTNSEELYTGEDFEITEVPTEAECRATHIALMATWIKKVVELQKETGFDYHKVEQDHPEAFDKNLISIDDYSIYWADVIPEDPLEEAKENYEAGYRLVPTENEPNGQFLDWWKTGFVLKFIA